MANHSEIPESIVKQALLDVLDEFNWLDFNSSDFYEDHTHRPDRLEGGCGTCVAAKLTECINKRLRNA